MATSSARYTDLYHYARTAQDVDDDLVRQAARLSQKLSYFEATCREAGFTVGSDSLGSALRSYGMHCRPVDERVRTVGQGFERADRRSGSWWSRLKASRWGRWFPWRGSRITIPDGRVLGETPVYVVRRGDTLSEIAKQHGLTLEALLAANAIADHNRIYPGQKIVIPGAAPDPSPAPVPTPVPTPTPLPPLHTGDGDRPSWLAEQINRLKALLGWITDSTPAVPPPAQPIDVGPIEKPSPPPTPKVVRAEDVPGTITRQVTTPKHFTPYYRGPTDASKSNCTWYAATALREATDGAIDLHTVHDDYRMGDAAHWAVEAREAMADPNHPLHGFVGAVSKKPSAGTILVLDAGIEGAGGVGHVAWVEEAELVTKPDGTKEWRLVISEENYRGTNEWPDPTPIDIGDPTVKRWRRTVTYPAGPQDDATIVREGVHFIHWDREYQKPI